MRTQVIKLKHIEEVKREDLMKSRLDNLKNGFTLFADLFEDNIKYGDPIVINLSKFPYEIIDGRHRIYLAREQGFPQVLCCVTGEEK